MFDNSLLRVILRKYSREFLFAIILSAVANILMLVPTIFMLQVYDRVMLSQNEITLIVVGAISLGLLISMATAEWFRTRIMISLGSSFEYSFSRIVFEKTFSNKLNTTSSNSINLFNDLVSSKQIFSGNTTFALLDGPWTPLYIIVMFMLHPWLGYLAIAFCLNLTFISWIAGKKTLDSKETYLDEERDFNSFVHSKLQNSEVIEAHGMLDSIKRKWWVRHSNVLKVSRDAEDNEYKFITLNKELTILKQSLALGLGAVLVIRGELSFGSMIAATLLMTRATAPIDMMLNGWKNFQQSLSSLKRLESICLPLQDKRIKTFTPILKGFISIKELNWSGNSNKLILNNISLEIMSGNILLISGPSGSGKSSLLKALLNLLPNQKGELFYDEYHLDELDWAIIGAQIGYLSQNYELFDGTVAQNIARMGEIDELEVILAAKRVGIHELILRLPSGYDTLVGNNSMNMSSGQLQCLALARAIYKNPKIIILDEPDSNLDANGQNALIEILANSKKYGATVCIVSHNIDLINQADKVIYLQDGKIIKSQN